MEDFTVLLVGARGSGKTVFLSSLHHLLGEANTGTGHGMGRSVRVRVRPADREQRLVAKYELISDPNRSWPDPTHPDEDPEWTFECRMRRRLEEFHILNVTYLDFSGERLERDRMVGSGTPQSRLAAMAMGRANAVLFLINGERVLDLLNGDITEQDFYTKDIEPVLWLVNDTLGPVHIVITKWDLLRGNSLKKVRRRLLKMEKPWLRNLVQQWRDDDNGALRLIPVSAVGDKFAYEGDSGKMVKRPKGSPDPFNLHIPFQAVLPDHFIKLAMKERKTRKGRTRQGPWPRHLDGDAQTVLAIFAFFKLFDYGEQRLDRSRVPVNLWFARWREPKPDKVIDLETAYHYVIWCIAHNLRRFERDFRYSKLS